MGRDQVRRVRRPAPGAQCPTGSCIGHCGRATPPRRGAGGRRPDNQWTTSAADWAWRAAPRRVPRSGFERGAAHPAGQPACGGHRQPDGAPGGWTPRRRQRRAVGRAGVPVLAEQRETIKSDAASAAYAIAYHWQQRLAAALEHAVTHALATLGLPCCHRSCQEDLTHVAGRGDARDQIVRPCPADVVEATPRSNAPSLAQGHLATTGAGVRSRSSPAPGPRSPRRSTRHCPIRYPPPQGIGQRGHRADDRRASTNRSRCCAGPPPLTPRVGSGTLTDEHAAWPSDADERVSERFAEARQRGDADRSAEFKQRYEIDLPSSVG